MKIKIAFSWVELSFITMLVGEYAKQYKKLQDKHTKEYEFLEVTTFNPIHLFAKLLRYVSKFNKKMSNQEKLAIEEFITNL